MKKIVFAVSTLLALTAATASFAQETANAGKDECLLMSNGCKDQVDSIQQRIKRLDNELRKGQKVYSADDLKKLQQKLKEANDILNDLEKPGH